MSSGFGHRDAAASEALANAETAFDTGFEDDQLEASTLAGDHGSRNGEPSTLNRGPETVLEAPKNPRRGRVDAREISFDDETQARPVDDHLLSTLRRGEGLAGTAANAQADLGVDYESLPSLAVRPPFDTYEKAFSERDPVTQLHAQRESARVRRAEPPAYREPEREPDVSFEEPVYNDADRQLPTYDEPQYRDEPSYREPSYEASHHAAEEREEEDVWGRREGSGARERPSPPPPARSYAAPVPSYDDASDSAQWGRDRMQPPSTRQQQQHAQHQAQQAGWSSMPPQADDSRLDEPMIPPAPRVPEEMHPAFVVGVQRIRTATPDAWGTPHVATPQLGQYLPSPMQAIHGAMPAQYAPAQNQPYAYPHAYVQQQQQQLYAQQQRASQYQHQPTAYAHSPQQYLQPGQRQPTPMPMHPSSMAPMSPSSMRAQPIGNQLTQPESPNAKIGRFAWFVAGAAFGITFAFFATGFFNGGKLAKDDAPVATVTAAAPAAAPVAPTAPVAPALAAAAPVAPLPAAAPAALAGFAPAVAPPAAFGAPAFAAPVAPFAPAAPSLAAAPPPVARVAPPAQRAPRFQAPPPRRPSAPASQGPKNLGGGGAGADDDAPAPRAPAAPPGGDLGDLLGAGLKP